MSKPKRIQRKRTKGWRMPEGTIYVGRPSAWGNPFSVDSDWLLWAGVALGFHGDKEGRHAAAVAFYRWWLTGKPPKVRPIQQGGAIVFGQKDGTEIEVQADEHVRGLGANFAGLFKSPDLPEKPDVSILRGHNLACFCPLNLPCHADVLLEIANG